MNFSERLAFLQKSKEITKKTIMDATGISLTAYFRYENGARVPDMSTLIALADFFGVSLDYLVGRTDNPEVNK